MSQRNIFGEASVRPWYGPGSPEPTSRPQRGPGRDTPSRFNRAARPSSQDWKAPDIKSNPITSVDFVPGPTRRQPLVTRRNLQNLSPAGKRLARDLNPDNISPDFANPPTKKGTPFKPNSNEGRRRIKAAQKLVNRGDRGSNPPKKSKRKTTTESQLFLESYYKSLEKSK